MALAYWLAWPLWLGLALALALALGADSDGPEPGALVRLTHDGLDKQRPSWAPDGRRLLFARHEPGGMHVWQYILDTSTAGAAARRLSDRKDPEYNGTFSPDGNRILFTTIKLSGTQGDLNIAAIGADGGGLSSTFANFTVVFARRAGRSDGHAG